MNLFSLKNQIWIDFVFENRNKSYGAYVLRRDNDKILLISLLLGCAVVLSPIILFNILKRNELKVTTVYEPNFLPPASVIDIDKIPIQEIELPIENSLPASKKEVVKFTEFKLVSADKVIEETVSNSKLVDVVIGSSNIEANDEGSIIINSNVGDSQNTEAESTNKIFTIVEQVASPQNGLKSFYSLFIKKFNVNNVDSSLNSLKVILQFVVEPDGNLSNITILRDPGYGLGNEAVRVLKTMPNWTPAMQNGRKVRSQFTLPITINLQQ